MFARPALTLIRDIAAFVDERMEDFELMETEGEDEVAEGNKLLRSNGEGKTHTFPSSHDHSRLGYEI